MSVQRESYLYRHRLHQKELGEREDEEAGNERFQTSQILLDEAGQDQGKLEAW